MGPWTRHMQYEKYSGVCSKKQDSFVSGRLASFRG